MPQMTLHLINARNQLSDLESWLAERLGAAFAASAALLSLGDTDVVVKAGKGVIPEKGHLGYAPEKGLIYITIDPEHSAFRANPDMSLERMLAHELHHSARWDGPGYGQTLGEALASEGLAGHFVGDVYGGPAELWESMDVPRIRPHVLTAEDEWHDAGYRHGAWFFGLDSLPKWLGYSMGYQMVDRYLTAHPSASASTLVDAPADMFRPHLRWI